jgi:anaphase-promoting complex subunit 1
LPYGRAIFTFGTLPTITKEAYTIPKLEYAVRILPQNVTTFPEPGKILQDSVNWGEFHNGVAAGLRIAPTSGGVNSSWIAFNKPSELTPEHAGFLYGLGLTGHLREMLTWHTFGYLTPKHDLTSIGVLLGLSAANVGNGNRHVTKLLAVHTPALLPTPTVDLNVSLLTQAAGLAGLGLLYMGSKNRRMAEVCLNQISRKDLVQPDLSNEHREAYTYAAAIAFGMIVLGKGSPIPADLTLLSRLRVLIHGGAHSTTLQPAFDINLTSPAATIALGLMFLRTGRQDVANVLTIPDTSLGLNRIQPSFLLVRTVARALIMWDSIVPTQDWLNAQLPKPIAQAIELRWQGKTIDDAFELAYYNIVAGCCFALGLKYAGTARQEAYLIIIAYFDMFSRLVYSNSSSFRSGQTFTHPSIDLTFDHKIKRSAIREGLNMISISLSMVMAGTGEISCFRRLRYSYGMFQQNFRYGIHLATHLSIGLLFLGTGRFTLGTSDAAIACMVAAFFPRSHNSSSDNKSYLQALRHLWVLAAEPRCLVARDVDTAEVVYLPIKVTTKEDNSTETTQLIAPALIPELDKLISIRVDTPRYWPFYIDLENSHQRKRELLCSQALYVKRRTAFLSYTEDPRGSRSLLIRSGSSTGDAAMLDFPQLSDALTHPSNDLSQFISSFSNNLLFLAFADHFSRHDGKTDEERLFHTYCHATLFDTLLQDKPQTLQQHLTIYKYRTMSPLSRYFHLRMQDLRFAADFYSKAYERHFSGGTEHNTRTPLVRENTLYGALYGLDKQLEFVRLRPDFIRALGQYAGGEDVDNYGNLSWEMAWYLLRNDVPVSSVLRVLRSLAQDAHMICLAAPAPEGTKDAHLLYQGIKEVIHLTGCKMTLAMWSVQSLDEIISVWKT